MTVESVIIDGLSSVNASKSKFLEEKKERKKGRKKTADASAIYRANLSKNSKLNAMNRSWISRMFILSFYWIIIRISQSLPTPSSEWNDINRNRWENLHLGKNSFNEPVVVSAIYRVKLSKPKSLLHSEFEFNQFVHQLLCEWMKLIEMSEWGGGCQRHLPSETAKMETFVLFN